MDVKKENEKARQELIGDLAKKAEPGNVFWQRVELLQGFAADYCESDHGDAPYGAEW